MVTGDSAVGAPKSGGPGSWELAVGWTAEGCLGLLQGAVVLSGLYDWPARTPILLASFLLHSVPGSLLSVAWSPVYLRLGRRMGRNPSRVGASAAFLSFAVFVPAAVYIHVTRLPGIHLLAPISIALTIGLILFCLVLVPFWRIILRQWFRRFETRGGLRSRSSLAWLGVPLLAMIFFSFLPLLGFGDGLRDRGVPRESAPHTNVILLIMDTTRADHLSCYGYERPTTPFLEALAGGGVLFEDAVSPSPWTLPSHASILSGRFPGSHGAHFQHWRLDDSNVTLAEILKEHGYTTGAFVSNPFLSRTFNLDQGFDIYDDELEPWMLRTYLWRIAVKMRLSSLVGPRYSERRADETAAAILRWIERIGEGPYFLLVNFNDPHAPYDPPEESRNRFLRDRDYAGPLLDPASHDDFVLVDEAGLSARDMNYLMDLYDGEIGYLDGVMGRLLQILEEKSGDSGTLVVVVGDHGESFGEHGLLGHRGSLYHQTLGVPLILSWPGTLPEGIRIPSRVQSLDIAPTILDLLGLPVPGEMEGESLVSLQDPPQTSEPTTLTARDCYAELYPEPDLVKRYPRMGRRLTALYRGSWKLIAGDDGSSEIFDLAADPGEESNLSSSDPEITANLTALLTAWRGTGETATTAVPLDAATADRLRSLGYLQ